MTRLDLDGAPIVIGRFLQIPLLVEDLGQAVHGVILFGRLLDERFELSRRFADFSVYDIELR